MSDPLRPRNNIRTFNAEASQVAFPLGGIGTGNVSLGARGDLRDWEIFNQPGKGVLLPNAFFAIRAQSGGGPAIQRVLEGPVQPPHSLSHGYHPWTAAGLPRLAGAIFKGEYPFAHIDFEDHTLPVQVQLEAFTPMVPLDPERSGLPCAVLTYTLTNTSSEAVQLTIAGSLFNPVGGVGFDAFGNIAAGGTGLNRNDLRVEGALRGLHLRSEQYPPDSLLYGDVSLATTHPKVTVKRAWLRGAWYDFLQEFWDDFSADGLLTDLGYDTPSEMGKSDTCTLGLVDTLAVGEQKAYRFLLTWFFPNRTNSWDNNPDAPLVRNHYAGQFGSSWEVARYLVEHLSSLEEETRQFHDSLFASTIAPYVLDAISANIVPLRSTTCFWLEDGRFFGFEGCFDTAGCCEGSCTHVWSYAQTLAYLFPSLEREMRRIEFVVETEPSGYMYFRTHRTFGSLDLIKGVSHHVWGWGDQEPEAAVDGQMGSILRAYREWLFSGDRSWLETVWPGIKRAIAFAATHWDTDRDNVLDGRQHNTYDIEFYGPNPLCEIYYLAALRAVEELARVMGEPDLGSRARTAFEAGSRRADELLWNGEYFVQCLDDVDAYHYQHGAGCLSDQLLGQLYARILGLGNLLPQEHVRSAIGSVFAHNFKHDFRDHVNCQRTYVLNDEAGLLLCTWPRGGRPNLPFVYSDEVWTGIEYQVAAHLIYEGLVEEGLQIVEAVRSRHDGVRRNPWDEVECGHHYARTMSSWALLLALSGFHYNAARRSIGFAPALRREDFRCFFSAGTGWGTFEQQRKPNALSANLMLDWGLLQLREVSLQYGDGACTIEASLNDNPLPAHVRYSAGAILIEFEQQVELAAGGRLNITLADV